MHTAEHVQQMLEMPNLDADGLEQLAGGLNSVYLCSESLEAALFSAGSVIAAVEAVRDGLVTNAVAVVRPPGHHAESHCAMGYTPQLGQRLSVFGIEFGQVLSLQ